MISSAPGIMPVVSVSRMIAPCGKPLRGGPEKTREQTFPKSLILRVDGGEADLGYKAEFIAKNYDGSEDFLEGHGRDVRRIALDKPKIPLLLSPRIREGFGKAADRETRRCCAAVNCRDDAR